MSEQEQRDTTIKAVLVFLNGNVAVLDENGQQVPDLQGTWNEKRAEIVAAVPDRVRRQVSNLGLGQKWDEL